MKTTFIVWAITLTFFLFRFNPCTAFEADSLLSQQIIVKKSKVSVRELLEKTIPKYGIAISYLDNLVPLSHELKFKKGESYSLHHILELICKNADLSFEERGGQILLKYYDRPEHEYEHSMYGRIMDASTGEVLIGATVYAESVRAGVAANGYGVYSLTLPRGTYRIRVASVGYESLDHEVKLIKDGRIDFYLNQQTYQLENVSIDDLDYMEINSSNVLASSVHMDMDLARNIPYLGEVDVFQGSLLLPGITNIGEGTSGINVRGGSSDQNLFMLDEAVVYNANHFFGLVSVFNPDAVQDVEILKGSLPAKYGGRTSSVMHVRQREGNEHEFKLSGGLGLITSRLMAEGPMLNESASFLVSARSTFWDVLLQNAQSPFYSGARANFQDLNAKMKFNVNHNNKIFVSSYFGIDNNSVRPQLLQRWGNELFSVRWNNIVKDRHFLNLTTYYSQYRYRVFNSNELADFTGLSKIGDIGAKFDMTSYLNPTHLMEYGASLIVHQMNPGQRIPGPGSAQNLITLPREFGVEPSLYVSSENNLNDLITLSTGIRFSAFYNTGHVDQYLYDSQMPKSIESIVDTLSAKTREAGKFYANLLPRAIVKFQLNPDNAVKAGYFQTVQYMHLLSNNITPSSEDVWKISDENIQPTTAVQWTLGYYRHFRKADFEASVEGYFKRLNNSIEFKDGADLFFNTNIETEILASRERMYGIEFFAKKSFGKFKGWVGYTLSRSEKRVVTEFAIERVNNGQYFPSNFDRTHDLSLSAIYVFGPRLTVSSNFVYYTGRPYSFPAAKYEVDGILVPHYTDRNLQRLEDYHRLDLSATLKNRNIKRTGAPRSFESSWVFSIYNVYGRRNSQSYYFTYSPEDPTMPQVQRLSVLGTVIPSITYNFKF